MTINSTFKTLAIIALLSGVSSHASADSNNQSEGKAPKAASSEVSHKFWNSFFDLTSLKTSFIDTTPEDKNDAIPVGKLGVDGGDKDMIVKLANEMAEGKFGDFDSLLIAHRDKLVFESYFRRGRIDLPHPQSSATKAYTSMAIGRAIQMGYLSMADLNKPVISFLKDLDPTKLVEGTENITLHKAMTMTSGLKISDESKKEYETSPDLLKGQGLVQAFLTNTAPITKASQTHDYKPYDPQIVMQVLDAVVPGSAENFIKTELLDKIGIENYGWRKDASGLPRGPSGSSMTSRNMLKWGMLTKNKGKWNGTQLVGEDFIAKATGKIIEINEDDIFFTTENITKPGYGYYWWQADIKIGDKSYFTTSAQGGGGQYIILIDELDLIIVTTAHARNIRPLKVTANEILQAFTQ
ncbi:serine hydrolase [Temperatibacter marinus]|uniref:Serine hydrolase n=1 Tax=Temperatibacter marinus TaxID=1456591 RepID=A0AA52HBM5_9PROT|nr:serine hydrolase [Temperatibacter marinus]WND03905.1 serine hydrolase [Temperatibacter marinus]